MPAKGRCHRLLQAFVTKLAAALHVDMRFGDAPGEVDEIETARLTRDPLRYVFHVLSQRRVSQDVLAEPVAARILRGPPLPAADVGPVLWRALARLARWRRSVVTGALPVGRPVDVLKFGIDDVAHLLGGAGAVALEFL